MLAHRTSELHLRSARFPLGGISCIRGERRRDGEALARGWGISSWCTVADPSTGGDPRHNSHRGRPDMPEARDARGESMTMCESDTEQRASYPAQAGAAPRATRACVLL